MANPHSSMTVEGNDIPGGGWQEDPTDDEPWIDVDCFSKLDESTFLAVKELKEEGNDAFKYGNLDGAESSYNKALELYDNTTNCLEQSNTNGPLREEYVNLLANLALIHLKHNRYLDAETVTSKALSIDSMNEKCSYRRATARLEISLNTPGGDMTQLNGAMSDVLNMDHSSNSQRKLFLRIETEQKRLQERELNSPGFDSSIMAGSYYQSES
jgi:tetratricopeptide (TPR) repeat protein